MVTYQSFWHLGVQFTACFQKVSQNTVCRCHDQVVTGGQNIASKCHNISNHLDWMALIFGVRPAPPLDRQKRGDIICCNQAGSLQVASPCQLLLCFFCS